mgnify:CR=1 FL=1
MKYSLSALFCLSFLFVFNTACAKTKNGEIPISELRAFSEAYYQIKSNYVTNVDDEVLLRAAIKGMVASLDKHSRYLPADEFKMFNAENEGEYAGVGLAFKENQFGLEIIEVIKNSPAARAKLKSGMIVTHIDQKALEFVASEDAFSLLRGELGSMVQLTVASASFAKPKHIELVREFILLETITSQLLPNATGYIAISQFTLNSLDEFELAIAELSARQPLNKLIIDLRNNPGGVMTVAVDLSDLFISQGKLLVSSGRSDDANQTYYATQDAPLGELEIVIVINKGSASASEILTAALHDHKKALILGERSFGKGSIQTVFPLNYQSGMKLTSAEYFSPLGHKIQDVGITPDVEFAQSMKKNPYKVSLLDDPQLLQAYNLLLKNNLH